MSEKYFLGSMTPGGFVTQFGEYVNSDSFYTYVLKGAAGTGKSSLMKKIADRFEESENVTRYYCSSDPDSLDGVVLHSSKAVIVDGTAPHTFDPVYPGSCQRVVDLGSCWDNSMLKDKKEDIVGAIRKHKELMSCGAKYSAALGKICEDTFCCAEQCLDKQKLDGFCKRFCKKVFGKSRGYRGMSFTRCLSAMTRYGYYTFSETLDNYLDVYYLCNDIFAASNILISAVAGYAVQKGYDVKLSPCMLFGNKLYEHLLIDEIGVALVSASPLNGLEAAGKRINMSRFYQKTLWQENKDRLKQNAALMRTLKDAAGQMMDKAKQQHDVIESYYINAMDFNAVEKIYEKISGEISAK